METKQHNTNIYTKSVNMHFQGGKTRHFGGN